MMNNACENEKKAIQRKRKARKLAVQALYQWLMSETELHEIETQFRVVNNMEKVDGDYFCRLLYGVPKHLVELEAKFLPLLDREMTSLNPVELTVIRLGTFELLYSMEVPSRVVLDEAVSLARIFGSQEGHRYVNGVLNQLAHSVRSFEIQLSNE